jgi:hypothetical protein
MLVVSGIPRTLIGCESIQIPSANWVSAIPEQYNETTATPVLSSTTFSRPGDGVMYAL